MHRALSARWLNRALSIREATRSASVPLYLCPAVGYSSKLYQTPVTARSTICARRFNHTEPTSTTSTTLINDASIPTVSPFRDAAPARHLPLTCSGCGAFAQTQEPHQFGYYNLESKRIQKYLHPEDFERKVVETEQDQVVAQALKSLGAAKLEELGLSAESLVSSSDSVHEIPTGEEKAPVCQRCHNLQNHNSTSDSTQIEMHHPTVETLRETIEESPHKLNHIYHVIDAADFPMSLIPRLNVLLGDIPLRTKNRRSRASKYQEGRKTELSFIITRSDLLGPTKEIVDSLMPYLREVLRDSLGRLGGRIRLGNVRCVSAKRGWWTKDVKESIWKQGGAGWLVGKVNVGKSQLFEAIYPKGRMGDAKSTKRGSDAMLTSEVPRLTPEVEIQDELDVGDLLPPPQPAQNYPEMPVVSSFPGTTASPIRVPFGNGKGELVDLPGLARSDLDLFVKEKHRKSLIMQKRIVPEQISIQQGRSLLLGGGLIRITPKTPNLVFLMYNFTPLEEHLTQTEKAIGFQEQTRESVGIENITLPGMGDRMRLAGTFQLKDDVTKKRAGPLTRKNAVGLQTDRLPFRVLSTDILIEGVGYVEIVAQVRTRDLEVLTSRRAAPRTLSQEHDTGTDASDPFASMIAGRRGTDEHPLSKPKITEEAPPEPAWPEIEVFSPEGRFISSRRPIQGWLHNKRRVLKEHKRARPRKSMKGEKKATKAERRAAMNAAS